MYGLNTFATIKLITGATTLLTYTYFKFNILKVKFEIICTETDIPHLNHFYATTCIFSTLTVIDTYAC